MFKSALFFSLILSFHFNGSAYAHGVHGSESQHDAPVSKQSSSPAALISNSSQSHSHDEDCGHLNISRGIEEAGQAFITSCLGPSQNDIRNRISSLGSVDRLTQDKAVCGCFEGENNAIRETFINERDQVIQSNKRTADRAAAGEFKNVDSQILLDGLAAHTNGNVVGYKALSTDAGKDVGFLASTVIQPALAGIDAGFDLAKGVLGKISVGGKTIMAKSTLTSPPAAPSISDRQGIAADPDYLRDNTNEKICLSFPEYLAFNQVPADNSFYTFLAQQQKFVPEEWDYNSIRNQLIEETKGKVNNLEQLSNLVRTGKAPMNDTSILKIYSLVARMKFLNANTVFKNLFMIDGKKDNHAKGHQEKLFTEMKSHLRVSDSSGCFNTPSKCRMEFTKKNSFVAFLNKAREAVADKEMDEAIRLKAQEELDKFTKKQAKLAKKSPVSSSVQDLWISNQLEDQKCDQPGFNVEQCTVKWGRFCGGLNDAFNNSDSIFVDGLDISLSGIYSPNPETNKPYKELVKFACDTSRGKTGTFFDFKNKYCRGNVTKDLCRPDQRALLVAKYLEDSDSPRENGNNIFSTLDTAALANFLRDVPVPALNDAQVKEYVARSSEISRSGSRESLLARHGEVPVNGTSSSFSDFNSVPTGARRAAVDNMTASSVASTAGSFDNSSSIASGSIGMPSSQVALANPIPQIQRSIDDNRVENSELNRKLDETIVEREKISRENPSDDKISRLDQEIKSLRDELKQSDSRYASLLEKMAFEKQVAQASPQAAGSTNKAVENSSESRDFNSRMAAINSIQPIGAQQLQNNLPQASGSSAPAASISRSGQTAPSVMKSSQMNSALMDANAQKTSKIESGLIVSQSVGNQNQVQVPVPADIFLLVEDNPEVIRSYASKKLLESNSNEDRVYLKVNVDGSTNSRALELIAVKQENGKYDFFTPAQIASADLRQGRTPAANLEPTVKAEPNWRLQRLRTIVGP